MIKKIISLLCCALPFSAGAATVVYPDSYPLNLNPGAGNSVGGDDALTGLAVSAGENLVVQSGNGIVLSGGNASQGLSVANNMYIGLDSQVGTSGDLYAETGIDKSFTISSDGAIDVGGFLQIKDGYTLGVQTRTLGNSINVSLGSVLAAGAFSATNVNAFTVLGAVDSAVGFLVNAETITTGAISSTGGTLQLDASGALSVGQLSNSAAADGVNISAAISAATITTSGNVENLAGNMVLSSAGAIDITGSLENSGSSLVVNNGAGAAAGAVSVSGTIKNDSAASSLTMNVASLNVAGGDSLNPSFVNKGNLNLTVAGKTYLEYGFGLSAMGAGNSFYLNTGTLAFGENANADAWLQVFSNDLNSFSLAINAGDIDAGQIINGVSNAAANMNLSALAVSAKSVKNSGEKLTITATGAGGDGVDISGAVAGLAGSTTNIVSAAGVNIGSIVNNAGDMDLNGVTVNLQDVVNTANLDISASTDTNGLIDISGSVSNTTGDLDISARQIAIAGVLTNNSGATSIKGSDSDGSKIALGGLSVVGGSVSLDSLVDGVSVSGGLSVTGGALNVGAATGALVVADSVQINGDLSLSGTAATDAGNVNVAASGVQGFVLSSTNGAINVDRNISATDNTLARSANFDAATISVGGNVIAENKGVLTFGADSSQQLTVDGSVSALNGGMIQILSDDADVGSLSVSGGKLIAKGTQIIANAGTIDIDDGIWFGTNSDASTGMLIQGTDTLALKTEVGAIDVSGGIEIATGNSLSLNSATDATVSGAITANGNLEIDAVGYATFNNDISNSATLSVNAANISAQDITNTSAANLTATGNVAVGNIINTGTFVLKGAAVKTNAIASTSGVFDLTATDFDLSYLTLTGGSFNVNSADITASGDISVAGNVVQGANTGVLNILTDDAVINTNSLTVGTAGGASADLLVNANSATYNIDNALTVNGDVAVASGAEITVNSNAVSANDLNNSGFTAFAVADSIGLINLTNSGTLNFSAKNGIALTGNVINSAGSMVLNSGADAVSVGALTVSAGSVNVAGKSLKSEGAINITNNIYQNGTENNSGLNINENDYSITASNITAGDFIQSAGNSLTLASSDVSFNNILATDLTISANPAGNWLNVAVADSVSGGVKFDGLEQMTIGDNYIFNDDSRINAAILEYAAGGGMNSANRNYWSTVSLNDDNTLGQITNATDGQALITVGGQFVADVDSLSDFYLSTQPSADNTQVQVVINDIVDQGTAIWLVHADDGIKELNDKIRNLYVSFCNADGTSCFNYLDSLDSNNGSDEDLPVYLSMRDTDGDGVADSIYVVFDPRFGGPVEVFEIQPIVGRTDGYTEGEFVSAGALDDLLSGQLQNTGFLKDTPIEVIPVMFKGTNLETMATELYNRMEAYNEAPDGSALTEFSRLFQVREIEQIAGSIALNEHTSFRSFEDRMFDEFIWNRNRDLKKAWLDFDFGLFSQNVSDNKVVDGDRFSVSGGFDWQETETLQLGLTARVSHMSGTNFDEMDLGYLPNQSIAGRVDIDVANTNVGLGGYLMKTLGEKTRVYGNGFLDIHMIDVAREQNFVNPITGDGSAFSLISEWGLLHDWLNQYIVGNMYVRAGYNSGFNVREEVDGIDYMELKSDGYLVLTPGYSLVAQKRIYPSSWMQIRPYASIGAEYDVLGAPTDAQYKFALANAYTDYAIDINPLWANIGGGVEVLTAFGVQVGLDYRYQYNDAIQLHNVKVSGSYRF